MTGRRRTWLVIIAAGYFAVAMIIGLWPSPVDAGIRGQIFSVLAVLHGDGVPGDLGYAALEFTANILFFVPIGVLLALLLARRRWWLAVPLGALVSGAIELSQLLLLPARYASWGDVAANTLGTVAGVLIVVVARAVRTATQRSRARRTERVRLAPQPRRAPDELSPARPATPATPSPEPDRSPVP